MALLPVSAVEAQDLRIATFNTGLSSRGPGLMLRDILEPSERVGIVTRIVAETAPDILVLQDVDWDAGGTGLAALAEAIVEDGGPDYPHSFAARPNAGLLTDLDMDGDGRTRGPRDAQGYGNFTGDGGMAVLSRYPLGEVRDLSDLPWADLPGSIPPDPPFPTVEAHTARRLSSVAHWIVPVEIDGRTLDLMTWSATPPIFDGPEDLNGRRNRDETAIWSRLLDGEMGDVPEPPFVILGNANLDPEDGEGIRDALDALLSEPRLRDPLPRSAGGAAEADPDHQGDPALDTAAFDGPGNLRLSYVLPSRDIAVRDAGVFWPAPDAQFAPDENWPAHRLVWVDVTLAR
ncbi:endonuclease/exonuclease/phosphatase family protein [Palleronia sp. LCG004]|uniref:endonuclease/exonuclease/phosphatase family protein n=1 Tax=Palleronia sp. LCG004 TaxID=3079304 RepID=UPI002943C791|nr:endonuclease/exonuclease/phosphatase family protein [Palleronia sp. LCG004]WOI56104.1 endonuclease/exonuclease/phosphatase family protein [Palleronia sp. LCG004]